MICRNFVVVVFYYFIIFVTKQQRSYWSLAILRFPSEQLFNRVIVNVCFCSKYEIFIKAFQRCHCIHFLKANVYRKLVLTKFYNNYNFPNLAEKKTCYKILQMKFVWCFTINRWSESFLKPNQLCWSRFLSLPYIGCHKKSLVKIR